MTLVTLASMAIPLVGAWFLVASAVRSLRATIRRLEAERDGLARALSDVTVRSDTLQQAKASVEERLVARTAEIVALNARIRTETERRMLFELDLRQTQKLESVGRLAAGVAHEINTPIQFVSDSCRFLSEGTVDLGRAVRGYREVLLGLREGTVAPDAAVDAIAQLEDETDLAYLLEHMPHAVERSLEGLDRVAKIVSAMKAFSHPERRDKAAADINSAVQSTLILARSEYKLVADVHLDLGNLPPVVCHVGEINQVVLNIVVNAAHAIEGRVRGTDQRGEIGVRTAVQGPWALIAIRDTGGGIPPEIADRIFDPFFTTKEIGKGTGQGLAIGRSVVVDKHGGKLTFETEVGRGSTFTLWLPVEGAQTVEPAPRRRMMEDA